jgi:CHAD domain-containing protein
LAKRETATGPGTGPTASPDTPLAVAGAAVLRQHFERMRATEAGARLGEDTVALRQLRVATRRLRAGLRVFVADNQREQFAPIEAGARAIARAVGPVRDLDILREDLRAHAQAIPGDARAIDVLLAALERIRGERIGELRAFLDEPSTLYFWEAFPEAVGALERAADRRVTVRRAAPRLIRQRLKNVIGPGSRPRSMTSPELHQLRIRCKRLRDTCEFFRPWFERPLEPVIEIATNLQDTLGSLHDGDVALESLRALVDSAQASGLPETTDGFELVRATLALAHKRQQERDQLLVRFRDLRKELRALARATKLKTGRAPSDEA